MNSFDLREGSFFGGEAVVTPHRTSYTATALEKVLYHRLPISALKNIDAKLMESFFEENWFPKDVRRDLKRGRFQQLSGPMGATQGQVV
jgi:hypothetical protein